MRQLVPLTNPIGKSLLKVYRDQSGAYSIYDDEGAPLAMGITEEGYAVFKEIYILGLERGRRLEKMIQVFLWSAN